MSVTRRLFRRKVSAPPADTVIQPCTFDTNAAPRVLMYSASTVGLGHVMRLLRIASELRRRTPKPEILLVTDARDLEATQSCGELAVLRLPSYEFVDDFTEVPHALEMSRKQLRHLRANLITSAVISFRPNVILMDAAPHGKRDELRPMLKHVSTWPERPTTILQLRDIPFVPDEYEGRTRGDFRRVMEHESHLYDHIFVAGDAGFFDLAATYHWPEHVQRKLAYLGFVTPRAMGARTDDERLIVASCGGGWEVDSFGKDLLRAFQRVEGDRNLALQLFTGPAATPATVEDLQSMASADNVTIMRFSSLFSKALASCDLAILQAGSSIYQILESDIPVLLQTRAFSSQEQEIRAQLLSQHRGIERLPTAPSIDVMTSAIKHMLDAPRVMRRTGYRYHGQERAADLIAHALLRHDARWPPKAQSTALRDRPGKGEQN